ncbi:hypothetical protein [Streptomyces sp. NPDC088727]|uniref:hypothetical protein n=1 Tax=Streptomyces sp. NPDC088727 TaxID=3365875 RepID=UPI0037FA0B2D
MDRCHLYIPLLDSSGATYPFAEVTLLDSETGTPIETPVYLEPIGGAPQTWPILIDPAVVNLWLDAPARVTLQALLPGGATFTRPGVDISPAPAVTVRSQKELHIGSAEGLNGDALLAVSPDGSAVWQVLDVLKDHRHEGDAPASTSLGLADPQDVFPGQTWLGSAISGTQGPHATALGVQAHPNGEDATSIGRAATAGEFGLAVGAASNSVASAVALGAGSTATKTDQVALGRDASGTAGPNGAVAVGAGTVAEATTSVKTKAVHLLTDGSVVLGNGLMPDLSWVGAPSVVVLGNAVVPRFFSSRHDSVLAGPSSTFGAYGGAGTYQPMLSTNGLSSSAPDRAALLSLTSALDKLGVIYLLDDAIDDELVDWTKTFAHNANLVLETGDGDGSKAGDLNRAKRNAAGPGTVTYYAATGLRDFRSLVFAWQLSGPDPAALATELVADVSADNVHWVRIPLAWRSMEATAASWYQTWVANKRPLPAGMNYLRLTIDQNASAFTPQIGRVVVRPAAPLGTSTLTPTMLTNPDRMQVSDPSGVLAMLTVGSRTVAMRGPMRTFTENKRPFIDAFTRTVTDGFGASPGGGTWSQSGSASLYSVNGSVGQISCDVANSSRHATIIDALTDVDVTTKVTIATAPTGATSSIGLSFNYKDTNNANRARLLVTTAGVVQLALETEVDGMVTTLGAATQVGSGFTAGEWWRIRAQRVGSTVRCRAWKDGTTEPTTWLHSVADTSNSTGRVGYRALASSGSTGLPRQFKVDNLQVVSGSWASSPIVTHNTWVRVLPQPFDGMWNTALASQLLTWASDTTPDVLAYAMMYTTGAPAVIDAGLGGIQVAGQASYGPLSASGTPIEGADFHDYLGVNWTFPNGETRTASENELHCLDCSGFVRMVYGYRMGIPMVFGQNMDGTAIPRQTKNIGLSGPGIIIAQEESAAPSLAALQIGDVPHFDADTTDPVAGQFDHNGIYIGVDTAGHPRFVNSRKTPHGPTFGDLGGASTLDGTGTYATSLRLIRRF